MPGKTDDVERVSALCDIGYTSELIVRATPVIKVIPEKISFVDERYECVHSTAMIDILLPSKNYNRFRIGVFGKITGTFKDIKWKYDEKGKEQLKFTAIWEVNTSNPVTKEPKQVSSDLINKINNSNKEYKTYEEYGDFISFRYYYDMHCLFGRLYGNEVTICLLNLVPNTLDYIKVDLSKMRNNRLSFNNPLPFSFSSRKSIKKTKMGEKIRFIVKDLKRDERDKDEERYNKFKHFEKYNFYLSIKEMDDKKFGERSDSLQHSYSFVKLTPGKPLDWLVGFGFNKNDFTLHYPDRSEIGDYEYCYELYLRYKVSTNKMKYMVLNDPFIEKAEKPKLLDFRLIKTNSGAPISVFFIQIHVSNFSDYVKENKLNVSFTIYQYKSSTEFKTIEKPFNAEIPINKKVSIKVPYYVPDGKNFAIVKINRDSLYLKKVSIPMMKIFYLDIKTYWPCDVYNNGRLYFTLGGISVVSAEFKNHIGTFGEINVDYLHHPAMIQIFGINNYHSTTRPRLEKILMHDYQPKIDKWDYHTQDIQKMLKALGYFGGSLDGRWGSLTNISFALFSLDHNCILYDNKSGEMINTPEHINRINMTKKMTFKQRMALLKDVPYFLCKRNAIDVMIMLVVEMFQG